MAVACCILQTVAGQWSRRRKQRETTTNQNISVKLKLNVTEISVKLLLHNYFTLIVDMSLMSFGPITELNILCAGVGLAGVSCRRRRPLPTTPALTTLLGW